jgi:hypothetical protein
MFPRSPHATHSAVAAFTLTRPRHGGSKGLVGVCRQRVRLRHHTSRTAVCPGTRPESAGHDHSEISLAAHYTIVAASRLLVRRSASSAVASPLRLCNTVSPRGATWTGPVCDLPLRPFASSSARS